MREVNTSIDPHEEMQCIVVVKTPWTIDNGFLTPTMKIKRNVIEAHYEPEVQRWFQSRKAVVWE